MHYTSHRTVLPEHNARYENGDTLTLGDDTEWEYFEASGWVPVAVRPVTNPVTGGNRFIESLVRDPDSIIVGDIVRNSDGAVTSASVVFPDGTEGKYTALVLSPVFPGAVDSYSVTYGDKTYTQPTMTRDHSGAVTIRPGLEVAQ